MVFVTKNNRIIIGIVIEMFVIIYLFQYFVAKPECKQIGIDDGNAKNDFLVKFSENQKYLERNMPSWYGKLREELKNVEERYHKMLPLLMERQIQLDNITDIIMQKQADLNRLKISINSELKMLQSLRIKNFNKAEDLKLNYILENQSVNSNASCKYQWSDVCLEIPKNKNAMYQKIKDSFDEVTGQRHNSRTNCCVEIRIHPSHPYKCTREICVNIIDSSIPVFDSKIINFSFRIGENFKPMHDEFIFELPASTEIYDHMNKKYILFVQDSRKLDKDDYITNDPKMMRNCTFCLVNFRFMHSELNDLVNEAMQCMQKGIILVFSGVSDTLKPIVISYLPFYSLMADKWSQSALYLPFSDTERVISYLNNVDSSTLTELRRNAYYIRSKLSSMDGGFIDTLISVLHKRLMHYPMPAKTYESSVLLSINDSYNSNTYNPFYKNIDDGILGPVILPVDSNPRKKISHHNSISINPLYDDLRFFKYLPNKIPVTSDPSTYTLHNYFPVNQNLSNIGLQFASSLGGNHPFEQFTIVILTHLRSKVLNITLQNLMNLPYLHSVIIVWNNVDSPHGLTWPRLHVPLHFVSGGSSLNSLNNRFLPYDLIKTEAVLSLDDDIQLHHEELILGFRIWRDNRDRIVGYPARGHFWDTTTQRWRYQSHYSCEMSLVLTGAAFLHQYFFYEYSYNMDSRIRDYVDEHMNCEDIAMNFLVSHITRKSPLKITNHWQFSCPMCGSTLWKRKDHMEKRSDCIDFFSKIFGYNPLLYIQYRANSILYRTTLPVDQQSCFRYV